MEERLGRCMTEAARFIIIFYFVESFGRFRGRSVFGAGGDGTAGKTSDKIRRRRQQTMTRRRRRRRRKIRVDLFFCHSQLCGAACSSGCIMRESTSELRVEAPASISLQASLQEDQQLQDRGRQLVLGLGLSSSLGSKLLLGVRM